MATDRQLSTASPAAPSPARFAQHLGVLSQVPHWIGPDANAWAYEPYVREMRLWADLFGQVTVYAPPGTGPMRGHNTGYGCANLDWVPVHYSLQAGPAGIRRRLGQFPGLVRQLARAIQRSDFVLVRSPGHFGMVGAALVRWLGRASLTKWAGENGAYPGEAWVIKWNRWIETRTSHRNPVLVYGPPRRPHQIEFLPALMDAGELMQARELSAQRVWAPPWRILAAGRLEPVKGFDLALRGLAHLAGHYPWLSWQLTLAGDGSQRAALARLASDLGIARQVRLAGALSFAGLQRELAAAHLVLMPGVREGWPKIIAEAWAHGAIPVAASAGLVPYILREPESGVSFTPNPIALAEALARMLRDPARLRALSGGLFGFAAALSLDQFQVRLEKILVQTCGLEPATR